MPPSKPSPRTLGTAIAYAGFAYGFHEVGATLGYYSSTVWFQLLAHAVSASALALVFLRAGQTARLTETGLVVFVAGGAAVGALTWELVEYLGVFPNLHWWGLDDSLLDLAVDAVGVAAVLTRHHDALGPQTLQPAAPPTGPVDEE